MDNELIVRRAISALVVSVVVAMSSSCATYGGRADAVYVSVLNDGSRVAFYMIPEEDWDDNGGRRLLSRASIRNRYEMGRTPQRNLVQRSGVYVLAWQCKNQWVTDRLTVSPGVTNEIIIGCGDL